MFVFAIYNVNIFIEYMHHMHRNTYYILWVIYAQYFYHIFNCYTQVPTTLLLASASEFGCAFACPPRGAGRGGS